MNKIVVSVVLMTCGLFCHADVPSVRFIIIDHNVLSDLESKYSTINEVPTQILESKSILHGSKLDGMQSGFSFSTNFPARTSKLSLGASLQFFTNYGPKQPAGIQYSFFAKDESTGNIILEVQGFAEFNGVRFISKPTINQDFVVIFYTENLKY